MRFLHAVRNLKIRNKPEITVIAVEECRSMLTCNQASFPSFSVTDFRTQSPEKKVGPIAG